MTDSKKPQPRVRVIKFGGASCGPCIAMNKAKTLERLKDLFPELHIIKLDIYDADGESPEGSEYAKNDALSDEYNVDALPTIIFEREVGDGVPQEFMRFEGGVSLAQLRKGYEEEKEKAEEHAAQQLAGKVLSWS